ncbi:MAG TPA: D-alanyl-D-alanine carboxypeptidase [Flavisolibacter sp.]|jgi:D-alanyl-D-alanine carboxypeptidase/D-alanyl-D-alanine-endopeptidase (penicillin-binding protein 4)|nr:D-alanyl-D-alanine carboxypeptidase [Flavisolibacter sp.]
MRLSIFGAGFLMLLVVSCSPYRKINQSAHKNLLNDSILRSAHIGISIFDPGLNTYLFNYQGNKYFVPASNTKLATCYAVLKYLGDSLPVFQYVIESDTLILFPSGDPTFLHPDFSKQKAFGFLKSNPLPLAVSLSGWQEERWGSGWSWTDYSEDYMAERSGFPVYGNVVRFRKEASQLSVSPSYFRSSVTVDNPTAPGLFPSSVVRDIASNSFHVTATGKRELSIETPYFSDNGLTQLKLLQDTLRKTVVLSNRKQIPGSLMTTVYSGPVDSLLRLMMHRSDNFFAEQTLLMVSNRLTGSMNDDRVIDTLLKTGFSDLPQKPRWVDGSGLSRYNLFTPQDFIALLQKMKTDFGMERMKTILATGNTGTLANYYKTDSSFIYAKTGTLSGVVALSGYLYTRKDRLLIFSVLVNNHQGSAVRVRRKVEQFIKAIRERY